MSEVSNTYVKRLRAAKNWDFATIYCKDSAPFNLPREAKFIVEEDQYLVIPTETAVRLDGGQPGEKPQYGVILEVVVDLFEVTRMDFIKKIAGPNQQAEVVKGLVNPDGSKLEK